MNNPENKKENVTRMKKKLTRGGQVKRQSISADAFIYKRKGVPLAHKQNTLVL